MRGAKFKDVLSISLADEYEQANTTYRATQARKTTNERKTRFRNTAREREPGPKNEQRDTAQREHVERVMRGHKFRGEATKQPRRPASASSTQRGGFCMCASPPRQVRNNHPNVRVGFRVEQIRGVKDWGKRGYGRGAEAEITTPRAP